jgi:hypothetical protein
VVDLYKAGLLVSFQHHPWRTSMKEVY